MGTSLRVDLGGSASDGVRAIKANASVNELNLLLQAKGLPLRFIESELSAGADIIATGAPP